MKITSYEIGRDLECGGLTPLSRRPARRAAEIATMYYDAKEGSSSLTKEKRRQAAALQMNKKMPERLQWALVLVAAVALLGYAIWRAAVLPFYCDEAGSYSDHASLPVAGIILYEAPRPHTLSNSHMLNSLGLKAVASIAGANEFALRGWSLLAYALYLGMSLMLVKRFVRKEFILFAFSVLNLIPYFVQFFSLARGYALAMGLLMTSIYFLCAFTTTDRIRHLWASVFAGALAVLGHFCLLHFFLALLCTTFLLPLLKVFVQGSLYTPRDWFRKVFQSVIRPGVAGLLLGVVVVKPIWAIMHMPVSNLEGGTTGFWYDTVYLMAVRLLSRVHYGAVSKVLILGMICAAAVIPLAVACFVCLKVAKRDKALFMTPIPALTIILILSALSSVLQHYLFGVVFLRPRTGLFFLPLFGAVLVVITSSIYPWLLERWGTLAQRTVRVGQVLVIAGLSFHFIKAANVSYAEDYNFDANTRDSLVCIRQMEMRPDGTPKPVRLGISMLFWPTTVFYQQNKLEFRFIQSVTRLDQGTADYYYVLPEIDGGFIRSNRLVIIKEFPLSCSALVRSRDQRAEDRGQRSEVRSQKSEVRSQKSEDRGQKSEDRGQRSEGRADE